MRSRPKVSAARIQLARATRDAVDHFAKLIKKLNDKELAALHKWLKERPRDPKASTQCEDVEAIQPFAVLCTACCRFKLHHLWPCPNFRDDPFTWIEPSGEGELFVSEDEDAYFAREHVLNLIVSKQDQIKHRHFFEPDLEGVL